MAHRAISIRCATIASKTTGTTILVSVQKSLPVWPIFLSRRTNQIVPPTGIAWISGGPCVIVGRGAQYFLRNRRDVFRAFLYASRTYKIHRLIAAGTSREKAISDVDTIDRDRAAFVKRYFKLNWPEHHLYDAMLNTEMGDSYVAEMLAYYVQQVASHDQISIIPNSR